MQHNWFNGKHEHNITGPVLGAGKAVVKLYKSKAWMTTAKRVRIRDQYLCQHCLRTGRRSEGNEVHHVNPLKERLDLALDDRNLITLCPACHNRMEDRASGRLSSEGEKLRKRINRKNGITDRE